MAWTNILLVPGLAYTLHYLSGAADPVVSPTGALSVGSNFTLTGGGNWNRVEVEITDYGDAVVACPARIVATALVFGSGSPYDVGLRISSSIPPAIGGIGGVAPYSGTRNGVADGALRYFGVSAGDNNDYAESGSFVIELDTDIAAPAFWTDFEGTFEDGTLAKTAGWVAIPATPGQQGYPAVTICTDPPEPPGPGGVGGDGPPIGGEPGNGSGPPPPGETQCFFRTVDGQRQHCCIGQDGNLYCTAA